MDTFVDIYSLNCIQEVIMTIKMYHLLAKHGAVFSTVQFNTEANDGLYFVLEEHALDTFPLFESYYINDPECEFTSIKFFQDVIDYFDFDEVAVTGLIFLDYMEEFYNKCKEVNMNVSDTFLSVCVDDFNRGIMQCGDGVSYMELFIPVDEIMEDTHSPLMLFYTDASLLSYDSLIALYDAFDYCKDVVEGRIKLRGDNK